MEVKTIIAKESVVTYISYDRETLDNCCVLIMFMFCLCLDRIMMFSCFCLNLGHGQISDLIGVLCYF